MLERARHISDMNLDVYTDGAAITAQAIINTENQELQEYMKAQIITLQQLRSDLVVLLVASQERIKQFIASRGRISEDIFEATKRAIRIQEEFTLLAQKEKEIIVIDRTELDFSKHADLVELLERINTELTKNT